MNRAFRFALAAVALAVLLVAGIGISLAQTLSVDAIVNKLIAADAGLKSYTASVHADVAMHTFPYLSPSLDGTYYHKEPSMNKIVFTSGLPFIAKAFSNVYPQVESPTRWEQVYDISIESSSGNDAMLKLVPRKHGRIDHIDAKIDLSNADLLQLRWNYNDGGYATLDQTYGEVSGHRLVVAQSGHLAVPSYNADLRSTFTNFQLNATIPDSVFAQN